MIVTFCGHGLVYTPKKVEAWLRQVVEGLIKEGATQFYLGGYGEFDAMAFQVVTDLQKIHPQIKTVYVKAYLDWNPCNVDWYDGTTYPPIEEGPPRFAITRRNKWLAETCDVMVVYLRYTDAGGAAAMYKQAMGKNKRTIRYEL